MSDSLLELNKTWRQAYSERTNRDIKHFAETKAVQSRQHRWRIHLVNGRRREGARGDSGPVFGADLCDSEGLGKSGWV